MVLLNTNQSSPLTPKDRFLQGNQGISAIEGGRVTEAKGHEESAQTQSLPVESSQLEPQDSIHKLQKLGSAEPQLNAVLFPDSSPANSDIVSAISPTATSGQAAVATAKTTTAPVSKTELSPGAQELYDAMKRSGAKATDAQRKTIARELDAACKVFKVDPKLMLALFKHESGGIKPNAVSATGALGLGQLTDVAMLETIRIAKSGQKPYSQHKNIFHATYKNPEPIKNNVWTSVAYLAIMKERWGPSTSLVLKRYGDPYVPNYSQLVLKEYRNLFGHSYKP